MKVHSFGCYRQRHNAQAMPEVLASFDQNQHCLVCDQEVLVEPAQRRPVHLGDSEPDGCV